MRQKVRSAITLGKVSIVGGGYGEVEGTCTNYQEVIRNIAVGIQFVKDTFKYNVKHAWMPQQVGLNSAIAEIIQQLGFETLTIGRVSDVEHLKMKVT
jgi:hypothetical protein